MTATLRDAPPPRWYPKDIPHLTRGYSVAHGYCNYSDGERYQGDLMAFRSNRAPPASPVFGAFDTRSPSPIDEPLSLPMSPRYASVSYAPPQAYPSVRQEEPLFDQYSSPQFSSPQRSVSPSRFAPQSGAGPTYYAKDIPYLTRGYSVMHGYCNYVDGVRQEGPVSSYAGR
eukprot:TRINITY_DN3764_c0_g1_i1.p2 TRINITY_DN3764_c0_g1~~TRINITY_DN3764_c0_g1_i1.p2  ORF type:complete len:171 (-),score=11.41 TRINITY_DN3764_c0_g1_i1:90-602(-)